MDMNTSKMRQRNYRQRMKILEQAHLLSDLEMSEFEKKQILSKLFSEYLSLDKNKEQKNVRKKK